MASSNQTYALLPILLVLSVSPIFCQKAEDLRQDAAFFRKKLPEFRQWLAENRLDNVFAADSLAVSAERVTLFLKPSFEGRRVCDSMQCAWNELESANRDLNGQFFHERLLRKWAFLAEVREDQAEVVVRCHQPPHFLARIYGKNGQIPIEGRSIRTASLVEVQLPPTAVEGANAGDNATFIPGKKVGAVCASAKKFFVKWYSDKGTPVLYSARIDTSFSFEDEFVVEVTHLSNEICPDGYFEFHRIHVSGRQRGDDVELKWEFQGKYGSGIIFPPRKNNYKDMELRYRAELETYQHTLFKLLLDYLRRA
ncbi:MAG: hypothetical protein ACK4Q5_20970 [Saprospiraceae bacterium]